MAARRQQYLTLIFSCASRQWRRWWRRAEQNKRKHPWPVAIGRQKSILKSSINHHLIVVAVVFVVGWTTVGTSGGTKQINHAEIRFSTSSIYLRKWATTFNENGINKTCEKWRKTQFFLALLTSENISLMRKKRIKKVFSAGRSPQSKKMKMKSILKIRFLKHLILEGFRRI